MTSTGFAQLLSGVFAGRVGGVLQGVAASVPTVLKYVLGLLLLVNIRSWPLIWHWHVFSPVVHYRLSVISLNIRTAFLSKQKKLEAKDRFLQGLCPVGKDPIKFTINVGSWAGPDDCDFNMHLSNSSYPKHLDWARFRAALHWGPTFFRAGGWIALGETHFKFLREIPMFSKFEMRMNLVAWDNKWLYLVVRYVTPKKVKSAKSRPITNGNAVTDKPVPSGDSAPFPSFHTPAQPSDLNSGSASGTTTPLPQGSGVNPAERIAQMVPTEEPDGATVHCIGVSTQCFKIGRITIPPSLVFTCEGFAGSPTDPSGKPYSIDNPPPHFSKAQELQKPDLPKGHLKTFQKFLAGRWKEIPEGERWFENALGPDVEERRRKNLEAIRGVTSGMQAAMSSML
ncbi:hypothetical protein BDY19DRAFT_885016 [Irpex rosettiformis]|uniref:Uncharacterized protein n=1 Tax=Irpex rosettiformis TaxID=378272 RepID=A0ACB8UDC2_9APHY|nr:hypothetical protein BDY19DRAFT_885016 [Irpex rosettiformis]